MSIELDDATNCVNKIRPSRISFHPEVPDFHSDWKYSSNWKTFDAPSIETLAKWISTNCLCTAELRDGLRNKEHFVSADWGAIDSDGNYDLAQAEREWCDTVSIIGHTKSSTPDEPRFRIIFLWERPITSVDEFIYNMDSLIEKYDSDPTGTDSVKKYWPCKEITQVVSDGYLQPVKPLPKNYCSREQRYIKRYREMRQYGANLSMPGRIRADLRGENVDGQRTTKCMHVAADLRFMGYEPDNIRNVILNSALPKQYYSSKKKAEKAIRGGIAWADKIIAVAERQNG